MSVQEYAEVQILVGNADVTGDTVWSQTSFQAVAAAQPGTCQIVVRDRSKTHSFTPGRDVIRLYINGELMYTGFLFTVDQGYFFEATPERRWTLSGIDLNILFDKLILYNHAHPTRSLDGAGTYKRVKTDGGYIVTVPRHTYDREYIWAMLKDTDIDTVGVPINTVNLVDQVGQINPDGEFTPPTPGLNLRAFMQDVSANVQRSTPGSSIWYISPAGYLVYSETDHFLAPFSVGDDEDGTVANGYNVKNLTVSTDISRIKNDVLVFTGNLDPQPGSAQSQILYVHNSLSASVSRYGRFQYSEVLGSDWLQGAINARSRKLLYQEGGPAMRAEFTFYKAGLYPGQVVTIHSSAHTFNWYDPLLGDQSSHDITMPIRAIDMSFPTPNLVQYRVSCSFDTQDPWGLLLALKRPPHRGLVQPSFNVVDRTKTPPDPLVPAETYMFVREYPQYLGGGVYQCSYAYIRFSLVVFVGGVRRVGVPEGSGSTVGFIERSPGKGQFYIDAAKRPYVEYHVWHDLDVQ